MRRSLTNSETNLVFPIPGSPRTSTNRHPPPTERRSRPISSSRPTKSVRHLRPAACGSEIQSGRPDRIREEVDSAGGLGVSRPSALSSASTVVGVSLSVRARSAISSGLSSSALASWCSVDIRGARFRPRSSAAIAVGLSKARSASASCVSPCAIRCSRSALPNVTAMVTLGLGENLSVGPDVPPHRWRDEPGRHSGIGTQG